MRIFKNLLLSLFVGCFCLAILEFIVFKFVLPTSDNITNSSIDGVIRYTPVQQGVYYERDGTTPKFSINANGWNSTKVKYIKDKQKNIIRIAVVGDSYVQASGVAVDKAFPEIIEQTLRRGGKQVEVYRYGVDGAPLSQYLHMIRKEVLQYNPDIILVQLIHNDFDESYRFLHGRYSSSFLKLKIDEEGKITEVSPQPYKKGWVDLVKNFRTFRYFFYQTPLAAYVRNFINAEKDQDISKSLKNTISSAVDVRNITDDKRLKLATSYVFQQLKDLEKANDFKLVLAMDGVREAVYQNKNQTDYIVGKLNKIAQQEAKKQDLIFIDLQKAMQKDYLKNKNRFEFAYDWHWNGYGHDFVGRQLAQFLLLAFWNEKLN